MILPLRVFGTLSRNSISLGATAGPRRERAWPSSSLRSASLGFVAFFERDESFHHFTDHRIGNTDDAGLGNGRMLHQRALDFERTDQDGRRI